MTTTGRGYAEGFKAGRQSMRRECLKIAAAHARETAAAFKLPSDASRLTKENGYGQEYAIRELRRSIRKIKL